MPECFEVKKMAQYLIDSELENSKIISFSFCNKGERILKNDLPATLIKRVTGQTIESIKTKAKFTFVQLETDVIVWHYRFTGIPHIDGESYIDKLQTLYSLPIAPKNTEKYSRFILKTNTGKTLRYIDTRCLSTLEIYKNTSIDELKKYCDMPLDLSQCTKIKNEELKKNKGKSIKMYLLDQYTRPSGIGNYLACEICAESGIFPNTHVKTLTTEQINKLNNAIKKVSDLAFRNIGYDWFIVFNKQRCARCKNIVSKEKFKKYEQTTHWCSYCQN
ncbi:hypothetical protein DID78_03560 [Candidatus Marinamargulisbacteria bacterium SCGC AG-343-D04]|nr:hypothetical protein DID78_03560 [Candidatus Marinamargulisbacteria bacterium SCGC AG-343-D04]